jgi:hypothetical protein
MIAVATMIAGVWLPSAATACSCVRVDRASVLERSAVAFRGVIVRAARSADGRRVVAQVRVIHRLKGRTAAHVTVTSVTAAGMCGYPLPVGAELDFAGRFDADGELPVGMCDMVPLNPHPWPDRDR